MPCPRYMLRGGPAGLRGSVAEKQRRWESAVTLSLSKGTADTDAGYSAMVCHPEPVEGVADITRLRRSCKYSCVYV